MEDAFSKNMSRLRKSRGLSQRAAATELGISQALLSHYENGAREPGLPFLCRACKYYGVSADYMLGLSDSPAGAEGHSEALAEITEQLRELTRRAEAALKEREI